MVNDVPSLELNKLSANGRRSLTELAELAAPTKMGEHEEARQ
jgi:hypothetical protein